MHPGYARWLLSQQKAAVFRRFPFTIILKEQKPEVPVQSLRLKIDPGSKTTGLALVNDATGEVVWAAELTHRGEQVRQAPGRASGGAPEPSAAQDPLPTSHALPTDAARRAGCHPRWRAVIANVLTWVARLASAVSAWGALAGTGEV